MASVLNVSFYRFVRLSDLPSLRHRVKTRAIAAGLHGSILLSEEGINGFLAGETSEVRAYLAWLVEEIPGLAGVSTKESFSSDIPFTRMLVKIKKEIITMGRPDVMPSEKTGRSLAPAELKRWYDERKDFVIVDTRNDYEISKGAFEGAVHYDIETFREFPEKLAEKSAELRDKTVVMYCTGGIRCEKATALALDLGIKDVFQLDGGILKYFEEVGGAHYRGECFVFDHRAAVDPALRALPDRTLEEKVAGLRLYSRKDTYECARVELALRSKGLPFERVTEFAESTPVLFAGGRTIEGANRILAHLDEEFSETRLLTPGAAERRTRMESWLEWVDGTFTPDANRWIRDRSWLSREETHALEVRLEKHLYRLKTPLQHRRRFLVVADITQADLAAYVTLVRLRAADFPRDYPERFDLVWEWMEAVAEAVSEGLVPKPKVLRRPGAQVWPN